MANPWESPGWNQAESSPEVLDYHHQLDLPRRRPSFHSKSRPTSGIHFKAKPIRNKKFTNFLWLTLGSPQAGIKLNHHQRSWTITTRWIYPDADRRSIPNLAQLQAIILKPNRSGTKNSQFFYG